MQVILARKVREVEELKEEVRKELLASAAHHSQHLSLIDALQRLGVAYHFEREIEEALEHIYAAYIDHDDNEDDNINNVSLRFRLLRQQGFNVSCGEPSAHLSFSADMLHISLLIDVLVLVGTYTYA